MPNWGGECKFNSEYSRTALLITELSSFLLIFKEEPTEASF